MSNAILSSNQSSAVVATVRQSTLENPFAYSEAGRLVAPHAVQHLEVSKSGGSVGASSTVSFDLPKQGMLCGVWVTLSLPAADIANLDTVADGSEAAGNAPVNQTAISATFTNTATFSPLGLYGCLRSARLETSGRVIEELNPEQIMAKISNMPFGARGSCERAARMGGDPEDNVAYKATIFLPFYLSDDLRYSINTTFSEPHRVTLAFNTCEVLLTDVAAQTAYQAHVPTDASLICCFRQLDDTDADDTISKNYGDGLLSRLIKRSVTEAVHTVSAGDIGAITPGAAATHSTQIDLKQTDAVSAIYVIVKAPKHAIAPAAAANIRRFLKQDAPLRVKHIKLTASGTTIVDCNAEYIQHFGRWGSGSNGDGMAAYGASGTQYVYKLDFGTGSKGHSNVVSMRELSNPRLEVEFYPAHANQAHEIHVIYDSETFLSENASTGRCTLSIAS